MEKPLAMPSPGNSSCCHDLASTTVCQPRSPISREKWDSFSTRQGEISLGVCLVKQQTDKCQQWHTWHGRGDHGAFLVL
jgi:hypothetical protein